MKTVQSKLGELKRVFDDEAFELICTGDWYYVSKSVWKDSKSKGENTKTSRRRNRKSRK